MSRKSSIVVWSLGTLFFVSASAQMIPARTAWAEPAKKDAGRLPDGRAYRIDPSGYRIIDELAELEVSVSDLERQNSALENETAEKQKIIDQLRQGKCAAAAVSETDLSAKKTASSLPPPASISCSSLTEPLQTRIAELESRVSAQNEAVKLKESSVRYGEQQAASLHDEVDILHKQLAQAPTAESLDQLREKNKGLESAVAELQEKLAASEGKAGQLAASLEQSRSAAASRAALSTQPAASVADIQTTAAVTNPPAASAVRGATIADQGEVVQARRDLKAEVAKIDSKIIERKRLLDSVQEKKIGVTLSVQPLKTADGRSLDSLRMAISSMSSASDAAAIRSGLSQIEKILDDDLALFHRLGRI